MHGTCDVKIYVDYIGLQFILRIYCMKGHSIAFVTIVIRQESCAIAKMTARYVLFHPNFFHAYIRPRLCAEWP